MSGEDQGMGGVYRAAWDLTLLVSPSSELLTDGAVLPFSNREEILSHLNLSTLFTSSRK